MAGDEVLSEGEIDALMEQVDSAAGKPAAGDDGEYRRFDFSAREHALLAEFTKLPALLARQGEALADALSDAFGLEFLLAAQPPELTSAGDALAALERHVAVSSATLAPLGVKVHVIAPAPLLSFIVNEYFGGSRNTIPDPDSRGTCTPSELRLAERLATQTLESLQLAWQEQLPLEYEALQTLGVPDRLEAVPPRELFLSLKFTLSGGEQASVLQLLLPFAALEPYRERFAPPRQQEKEVGSDWESYFRRELPGIALEIAGVLACKQLSLAALLELQPGSVIPIEAPQRVALRVDQITVAEGRYGTFEGSKALQIDMLVGAFGATGT